MAKINAFNECTKLLPMTIELEICCPSELAIMDPLSLCRLSDPNMEEVSIEEEEEGFTDGGLETSPISSSHSSRVSDGAFEEPLVVSQGGPLLATKELGNQVMKESVDKDIHEKVGQLSLQEGGAGTQSGIAVTAAPCTAEVMFDRHSPPANLTSTRDAAHQIIPPPSSVSVSRVPEVVEQQRSDSVSVEVDPITPATSTSDLESHTPSYSASPHTPMFSPPGPVTSIEAKLSSNRSSSYLQPYTPSNSPSPCSSPLHHDGRTPARGGGGMRFESLVPLKHVPVTVSWAASPGDFVVSCETVGCRPLGCLVLVSSVNCVQFLPQPIPCIH